MPDNSTNFMKEAIDIAFSMLGKTSPNPSVGAVIVRDGRIISKAGTCPHGGDHAEIGAILSAGPDLRGAEMYITLEPCCHYGKTPPCTDAIIEAGIKRVFIPLLDPNPLVSGKGVLALKDAGVDLVIMHDMAGYAVDLIRQFRKSILRGRAFVIHKSAVSLDGRIATRTGDSRWISSDYSRYIVHRLRSIVDAVVIGKGTLLKDNPALTVRIDSFPEKVKKFFIDSSPVLSGRDNILLKLLMGSGVVNPDHSPTRVIIGIPDELDLTKKAFNDDNYLIFTDKKNFSIFPNREDYPLICELLDKGKIIITDGESKEQIDQIVEELYKIGKMLILLEGGGTLSGTFFDAGEIDQFLYFFSPMIIGNGLSPVQGSGVELISGSLTLKDVSYAVIKDNILCNGYREAYNFEMV